MNRFKKALQEKPFQLLVSLPSNDLDLAKAAIEEGADGIKVHINVYHRASGNSFGPLTEYQGLFQSIRALFDGPIGIVPADSLEDVSRDEIDELHNVGIDYYSVYAHHMPTFMLETGHLARTFAIDNQYDLALIDVIRSFGMDALEASIIPGDQYGTRLSFADLLKYRYLVEKAGIPVVVPSQRRILPEDVSALRDTGVKAFMIGAVSSGKTPEEVRRTVANFRNVIDR